MIFVCCCDCNTPTRPHSTLDFEQNLKKSQMNDRIKNKVEHKPETNARCSFSKARMRNNVKILCSTTIELSSHACHHHPIVFSCPSSSRCPDVSHDVFTTTRLMMTRQAYHHPIVFSALPHPEMLMSYIVLV